MASLTRWEWVWVNSWSLWWTGRPGVLQFMGSQRVGYNWATELNWTELNCLTQDSLITPARSRWQKVMGFRDGSFRVFGTTYQPTAPVSEGSFHLTSVTIGFPITPPMDHTPQPSGLPSSVQKNLHISSLVSLKVLVAQLCLTLCNTMNCSPPESFVHGILQARVLEWVANPFSRGSSWPRDWTQVSCIADGFLTVWATRECLSNQGT